MGLSGMPAELPDDAPIIWSSAYKAILVAGKHGLYAVRGKHLEPLRINGRALGQVFFLRDLPLFNALAIGDRSDRFFLLDAGGRLRRIVGIEASEKDWWFSGVAELREQKALVVQSNHESFLLPMHLRKGRYVASKAQQLARMVNVGNPGSANTGQYYSAIDQLLVYGHAQGWWPFHETTLQKLGSENWEVIPGGDLVSLGTRPFMLDLPSRNLVLITGKDRLFTYSGSGGLRPVGSSETSSIGRYAWATEIKDMDKVVVRSEKGLYELTKDSQLLPITSVDALASRKMNDVVEIPGANVAVVLTDKFVFGLTANNKLTLIEGAPVPEMFTNGSLALGIVGRGAAFFQARNGHFVVTTRESGHCPQE